MASLLDIALMKLVAIMQRGSAKDFIDLYFIAQGSLSIEHLASGLREKYGEVEFGTGHQLRSLCYFEDAEVEKLPSLITEISWGKIRAFFEGEVRRLADVL